MTRFTELRRDGLEVERWNMLHPLERREPLRRGVPGGPRGPVIASTDYMRAFADQIRHWVPGPYEVLGTNGYGRSDYRAALRRFFEVDRHYVAVAALKSLAEAARCPPSACRGDRAATGSTPTRRSRRRV